MIDKEGSSFEKYFQYIQGRKIQQSILIIGEENYSNYSEALATFRETSFHYLMTVDANNITKWRQIITFDNGQVISNDLKFDDFGIIIEDYDLQGAEISATSLSWSPFNRHENCNEEGWECDNSGLLVDVMSLWANKYNFTWDLYNDLDGDWGLKPVSGKNFQVCI